MADEKRKHIRVNSLNLSHVAVGEEPEHLKQAIGRTLNVSETGILLETHFPIAAQQNVSLTIGIEEDLVEMRGKVVHLIDGETGRFEMGVQFVDIDERATRILREFIKEFRRIKSDPKP
jgi:c-di-GMP-binding flagellar brake protein YcgR